MPEALHTKRYPDTEEARAFIEKLRTGAVIEDGRRIAVVVAHQDDESLAFATPIMRIPECLTVHVTDGAPAEKKHWGTYPTKAAYAEARDQELAQALDIAGHTGERLALSVPDQEVALRLAETAIQLSELFLARGIAYVFTHAYEGGHADHDAVSFAVHAAKKILAKKGVHFGVIEAPFYRTENSKLVRQSFVDDTDLETIPIELNTDERRRKREMFDTYATQSNAFLDLSPSMTTEWLREAPDYDFRLHPNDGQFSHIFADSKITPEKWSALTQHALRTLGLEEGK